MDISQTEVMVGRSDFVEGLMAQLAATYRVFRTPNGVGIVDSTSHLIIDTQAGALGRHLRHHGLVRFVGNNSRPVAPHNDRVYGELGGRVFAQKHLLPQIHTIINAPALTAGGKRGKTLLARTGYDPSTQTLVTGTYPPPATENIGGVLRTWFSGVPFNSAHDRANLTALAVACLARPALDSFPLVLFTANRKNVGKTTVASAIGHIFNPQGCLAATWSGNEDKTEFSLASHCGRPGPNYILIDNVRAKSGQAHLIRSQALSAGCYGHSLGLAPKNKNVEPLFDPIFALTMNDARLEHDLADKAIVIALHASGSDHSYMRPHPVDFAREFRAEIIAESLAILKGYELTTPPSAQTRFGPFEALMAHIGASLDIPVDLGPDIASAANTPLIELNEVYEACPTKDLQTILEKINTSRLELVELPAVVRQFGKLSPTRRAEAFAAWLRLNATLRPFFADGTRFIFRLEDNELTKEASCANTKE